MSRILSGRVMLMVGAVLFALPLVEAAAASNSTISSTRPMSSASSSTSSPITPKLTPASSSKGSSPSPTRFSSSTRPSSIDCKAQLTIGPEEVLSMVLPNVGQMSDLEKLNFAMILFQDVLILMPLIEEANTLSAKSQMFTDKARYTSISLSIESRMNQVVTEAFGPNGHAIVAGLPYTANACLFSTCTNQYSSQSSAVLAAGGTWKGALAYKPLSPCCDECIIYGDGVEISYWPTPAPTPAIATLVDKANHTFVSPSVYAGFTQLYAQNRCGQVGGKIALTTLAFNPQDLSTSSLSGIDAGSWTAINYAELAATRCACTTNCPIDSFFGTVKNSCTPQMSIPTKVSALIPEWKSCLANYGGIFDPPIALTPAGGLTVPKAADPKPTPENNNPNTPLPNVESPAPANTPQPGPVQTPAPQQPNLTPNPNPPTQPQNPNPQQSANPPNNPPQQENNQQNPTPVPNNPAPNNPSAPAPQQSGNPAPPSNPPPPPNNAQPTNNSPPPQNNPQQAQPSVILAPALGATVVTANGQVITANPQGNFVVGSQTLVPGGPAITVANGPISLATSPGSPTPVVVINGQPVTANPQGNFVVGGQTLVPGSPAITISGTPVSIPIGATQAVVGGTTIPANPPLVPTPVFTVNGQPITANSEGNFVIGTQTLTPGGPAVTISGTLISIGPGATQGVVGSTTVSLGAIINSILTATNAPSGTSSPAQYTGDAQGSKAWLGIGTTFSCVFGSMAVMIWL